MHKVTIQTDPEGMVQVDVYEGPSLEFRAMRRGGLREGIRMAETFMEEGPDGFAPRLRGASYLEIAQAITRLPAGERFTSHKVTDLIFEEGVHDRSLVLKNVSSALTKLRKREVPYMNAAGKQGKSVLYERDGDPAVAVVVGDLQD